MTRAEARERAEKLYAAASESTICDDIARALLLAQAEAYESAYRTMEDAEAWPIEALSRKAAALRREAEAE